MATNNKIPKCPPLRFPNFNDEWTQCYYKDIFDIIVEKNNNLEFENVVSASLIYGVISRNELGVDIKYSSESIRGYKIVRDGDYIIHLRSFQGGFAFSRLNGICSPAYTILRPKPLYISYGFFEKYFTSSRFINSLKLVTYGIRDGRSIAVDEWMQEVGSLPTLAEQKKIADFLSLIDERITNLSETIKERKREKAGLLNQLFSQKLRFPDFNDEWKKCFVSDFGQIITGTTPPTSDIYNYDTSDYLWASPSDLGQNKYIRKTKTMLSLKGFSLTRSLPLGSVLVSCIGIIGKVGIAVSEMSTNQQINAIIPNLSKVNSEYVYYAILNKSLAYSRLSATQVVPILSKREFERMPNQYPSLAEQKKIADFLSLVDERIELEEQLLKKYEEQKKYLLRQMFV